jgi:D-3-phosphoglycerate dehydrogenase
MTREELTDQSITGRFKRFEQYGVKIDIASDTTAAKMTSISEFVLKIETEGPEWVDVDRDVMEKIADAEVILTHFSAINAKMIRAAKNVRLIGVMRSGVENVNLEEAKKRDIIICNCPGRVSEPVADFTVAVMLVESRNIIRDSLNMTKGVWKKLDPADKENVALRNRTVGLIGYGIIGHKVAARLKPFGAKVQVYDPYCKPEFVINDGIKLVPLDKLCSTSDFISVHARLTSENESLIGEKEFSLMRPNAIFINTARAGLVDEDALVKALKTKQIRSAALDVFRTEPLPPDHPLMKLDNVTLTPHKAGATNDVISNSIDIIVEELERYFLGKIPRNSIVCEA